MKINLFSLLGARCLLSASSSHAFIANLNDRCVTSTIKLKPPASSYGGVLQHDAAPKYNHHPNLRQVPRHGSPLFTATLGNAHPFSLSMQEDESNDADLERKSGIRKKLGNLTGLSLSGIRASARVTTRVSLTATRKFLRTLTGVSVTGAMKALVGLLPPWCRYFLQPFLIIYYVPLVVLKGFIGSTSTTKKDASVVHEKLVDYWKEAIKMAENQSASWPLHVTSDGRLQYDLDDDNMNDAIVDSIELKYALDKKTVVPPSNA